MALSTFPLSEERTVPKEDQPDKSGVIYLTATTGLPTWVVLVFVVVIALAAAARAVYKSVWL